MVCNSIPIRFVTNVSEEESHSLIYSDKYLMNEIDIGMTLDFILCLERQIRGRKKRTVIQ